MIWCITPKHIHSGRKNYRTLLPLFLLVFSTKKYFKNNKNILKIIKILTIKIGIQCIFFTDNCDAERITRHERHSFNSSKVVRLARKQLESNEFYKDVKGLLYGPGITH